MYWPVTGVNVEIYLVESPLRKPVVDVMGFQLQELLPRKNLAFLVAREGAIVSESHQIAQRVFILVVPSHRPLLVNGKASVVGLVHMRQVAFSRTRLPPPS